MALTLRRIRELAREAEQAGSCCPLHLASLREGTECRCRHCREARPALDPEEVAEAARELSWRHPQARRGR